MTATGAMNTTLTVDHAGTDTIVSSFTFHQLTIILCGACTAVTLLFSGIQLLLHATHFSNPGQQTQYVWMGHIAPASNPAQADSCPSESSASLH